MPFLSFKAVTHVYLLKISITHNKREIPLLTLLISCLITLINFTYTRKIITPQILAANDEYTLRFSNCLVIGLCRSSAKRTANR